MSPKRKPSGQKTAHRIFIVSDGTGNTASQALRAALVQFADVNVIMERRAETRSEAQIREVLKQASTANALIVHTMVSKDLRRIMSELGRLYEVETIDLMGPLLARLAEQLSKSPSERPGLFRELNRPYFQRIEAMEYTFRHDDGRHVDELDKADIVLIGVSRTFKTPLSIYLAFRGWHVANVPIVMDLPVPPTLFDLKPERVFALTTSPHRLTTLRQAREHYLGGTGARYSDPDFVRHELTYAREIFARQPDWRIIQVTDKPIEEIASELLEALRSSDVRH